MFRITTIALISTAAFTVIFCALNDQEASNNPEIFDFFNWTQISRVQRKDKGHEIVTPSCKPLSNCTNDSDCHVGKCSGIAVGTCNCSGCTQFAPCQSDANCGGLNGACTSKKFCDCDLAFKCGGLNGALDALLTFCNRRKCVSNSSACLGLPCNIGICTCPAEP